MSRGSGIPGAAAAGRAALAALALFLVPHTASAACQLGKLGEFPVTMVGLRPTVPAKINGTEVQFLLDSGAFYSTLSRSAAAQLNLPLGPAPPGLRIEGLGGTTTDISVATVKILTLLNIPLSHVEFIVGGSDPGSGVVGLLGENLLRIDDIEYDLAHGVIRLMRPHDCGHSVLAYWASGQPFSVMDIDWATPIRPHTTGTAYLDGAKIHVMFDTGSSRSFISMRAAQRAGFRIDGPNTEAVGFTSGLGRRTVQTYSAPFVSFKIGDEEIRNARLLVGDSELPMADMLIGADFFLSHRIYVASSQHKLYFTYNGGPVFNLTRSAATEPATPEEGSVPEGADAPTDAAGFSRRGAAFAARQDFTHAIADYNRAVELQPEEPEYLRQRALARAQNGQRPLALSDVDQALKLNPRHVPSLLLRAELHLADHESGSAEEDLDMAERFAPPEADIRLELGGLNVRAGRYPMAVAELKQWIEAHREDGRLAAALNERCFARALWGHELDEALADCNTAVRLQRRSANFLYSRGLVEYRCGQFLKAVADWDAALAIEPKSAWALYSRGIGRIRIGKKSEGQADIAAAVALTPRIAELAKKRGLAADTP